MTLGQPTIRKAHMQPTSSSCQSLLQDTMQVSNTVDLFTDVALVLDLEATFKEIKISQNIEKEVCTQCQAEFCRCPAFTPGTPCSSVSSTPTNISDEQIPELVANKPLQVLHIPVQSPSDEEADREVAAICRAPEYYRVRSHVCRRCQYFMYNALDDIGEITQQKMTT